MALLPRQRRICPYTFLVLFSRLVLYFSSTVRERTKDT